MSRNVSSACCPQMVSLAATPRETTGAINPPSRHQAAPPLPFPHRKRECDVARKTAINKKSPSSKTAPKKKSAMKASGRSSAGAKARKKAGPRQSAKARLPKGPVWQWSAVETAAAIRSGAISSVEVTQAHIARMRAVNPKLNAVVVDLSEEALQGGEGRGQNAGEGRARPAARRARSPSRKTSTTTAGRIPTACLRK